MAKYTITYAFDCPCYGNVEIDADSPEHAAEIAKQMYKEDTLIDTWDASPEAGCENYRVVSIAGDNDGIVEVVDDGFDLDDDACEYCGGQCTDDSGCDAHISNGESASPTN
jgi:hypothetical protein